LRRDFGPDGEIVSRLQDLGLNLYESRAYLALIRGGQLTARGVGQAALVPHSRTYDVLESLRTKGYAISTPSSPKLYTPIPFERVFPALYETRKEEIQSRVAKAHEEAQFKLDRLTEAYEKLSEDLGGSSRSSQSIAEPVWVLEGRENIERMVVSLVQGARKELMRITRPPDLVGTRQFDPFYLRMENWRHTGEAAERGVKVRWLSLTRELPSYPGLRVTEPPERRYYDRDEDILEKFMLADGGNVLMNLYDPKLSAFGSIAMLMKSEAAYGVFRDHFDAMWDKAKPLDAVLPKVREQVAEACSKLSEAGYSKAEERLYRALAQAGASTQEGALARVRRKGVDEGAVIQSFNRLVSAGIIVKSKSLGLFMVENPLVVKGILKNQRSSPG